MSHTSIDLLQHVHDLTFWQSLCPELTITEEGGRSEQGDVVVDAEQLSTNFDLLKEDGYFKQEGLFSPEEMKRLSDAVMTIADSVAHPVFALVYDDVWSLLLRLRPVVERIVGKGYKALPDFWVWRLMPDPEDSGWRPHRDRAPGSVLEDGTPQTVSLWLALTDATPLNGCMYVLPASLDKRYHTYGDNQRETVTEWQDIRALPAQAGSLLCWTSQLLHWGGRSSERALQPRISVAFELQSVEVDARGSFLLDPHEIPSFSIRLALIAQQLLQYQHMASMPSELSQWCRQQIKLLPSKRSFSSILQSLLSKKS